MTSYWAFALGFMAGAWCLFLSTDTCKIRLFRWMVYNAFAAILAALFLKGGGR